MPASSTMRIPGMLEPSLEFCYSVKHDESDKSGHKKEEKTKGTSHCFV